MKPKHQRLLLALVAVIGLMAATLIAINALSDEASYFYTPTSLKSEKVATGRAIRLGGLVKQGSIRTGADGITTSFIVRDKDEEQRVQYIGVTPNLFVEGSGVVADGRLDKNNIFIADTLLAKHDENYVPRELQDMDMNKSKELENSVIP